MQNFSFRILFSILSESKIADLATKQTQAQSNFIYCFQASNEVQKFDFKLQIKQNFILQLNIYDDRIISGLQFQRGIYFRCKYDLSKENISKNSQIRFELFLNDQSSIELQPSNSEQIDTFDNFIKVLGGKYIKQLGFHSLFKAQKIIGRGISATVYKAQKFIDKSCWAIKAFSKQNLLKSKKRKDCFQKQFQILTKLKHRNIIKLDSAFETQNSMYLVLQYCSMSLLDFILKFGFPSLEGSKLIIINLLLGLQYLHGQNIMHRDIKLENIMLKQEKRNMLIPIIVDFGLAQNFGPNNLVSEKCGTPGFTAPEIFHINKENNQYYTQACDIFSLGVVCHILLYKKPVFTGKSTNEIILSNKKCQIDFNASYFNDYSNQCLDFMKRMLQKDPSKRINITDALSHPFLRLLNQSQILEDEENSSKAFSPIETTF